MNVLIAGRSACIRSYSLRRGRLSYCLAAVQGVGAGGIAALGQIILGDLVPLQERGVFNGLIVM